MRHSAPGLSPAPAEEAGTPPLCPSAERRTELIWTALFSLSSRGFFCPSTGCFGLAGRGRRRSEIKGELEQIS